MKKKEARCIMTRLEEVHRNSAKIGHITKQNFNTLQKDVLYSLDFTKINIGNKIKEYCIHL